VRCACQCGRVFGGIAAFDAHRWGPYTNDPALAPTQNNEGRCHDPKPPYELHDGVWRRPGFWRPRADDPAT
jgi:hypothetical protein